MLIINYIFFSPQTIIFNGFPGYAIRGLFFNLLNNTNPKLAQEIHNLKRIAPYSVKPIEVLSPRNYVVENKLPSNSTFTFSIVVLEKNLIEEIKENLINFDKVTLMNKEIILNAINVKIVSFDEIYKNAKPLKKFSLRFLSPTSFRAPTTSCCEHCPVYRKIKSKDQRFLKEKEVAKEVANIKLRRKALRIMPDLNLALKNLLKILKIYENISFNLNEFKRWLDLESVVISGYPQGIKTKKVYEHVNSNKFFIGFIGRVNYSIRESLYNEENAKILNSILKFGEIINIGSNRTAGLGYIRLEEKSD